MTFLVDNQLPPLLVRYLQSRGHTAGHVADAGLNTADDRAVRAHAALIGAVIVSKDEDFFHLAVADPAGPPLVWVRLGNCRTPALLATFDQHLDAIVAALSGGQSVIELR